MLAASFILSTDAFMFDLNSLAHELINFAVEPLGQQELVTAWAHGAVTILLDFLLFI
jgi:hypothetical protein